MTALPRIKLFLCGLIVGSLLPALIEQAPAFDLKDVAEQARILSTAPYQDPRGQMPQWLLEISYDQLRDIRFIPAKSHWRAEKLPFEL